MENAHGNVNTACYLICSGLISATFLQIVAVRLSPHVRILSLHMTLAQMSRTLEVINYQRW